MTSIANTLKSWFPSPSAQDREGVRQVRPFFWLVLSPEVKSVFFCRGLFIGCIVRENRPLMGSKYTFAA